MKRSFICCALITALSALSAVACDLCGCYTPQLEALPQTSSETPFGQPAGMSMTSWRDHLYLAIGEQFTYFNTVQIDGREVANPTNQYLASSITQLVAGYSFTPRFALQANVPLIYRSFQRPEGFTIDHGTESGLGDVSLLGRFVLFHVERGGGRAVDFADPKSPRMQVRDPDFTASFVLLGGVKFPTGDSSRIKEEFNEVEVEGAPESGIHGHDLTLGTGSYDGIFGGETSLRYKNAFLQGDLQFTLRGDGLHQYHFANDLSWSGGPGYYFIRTPRTIVGLQFVVSGEHKDADRFRGEPAEDTGITSVSVGPRLIASFGKISAEIGTDLPVLIDNTALQVVPDYRIRGGISIRFRNPNNNQERNKTMITRRQAIRGALMTGAALTTLQSLRSFGASSPAPTAPDTGAGPYKLPPLPYAYDALEPHIDARTMHIHHDKHHAGYVKKLNAAVAGHPELAQKTPEELLQNLDAIPEVIRKAVRNNGGGDYNHTLFWQMMKPKGGGEPAGALGEAIGKQFGSFASFKEKFSKEAGEVFGSGWAWLLLNGKELAIDSTPNQDSPISQGKTPLLGIDVWEHAYYLKRQNRRSEYVEAWWKVVNWEFVSQRYEKGMS